MKQTSRASAKHCGRRNRTSGPSSPRELALRMHQRGNSLAVIVGSVGQPMAVVRAWIAAYEQDLARKRDHIRALAHGEDADTSADVQRLVR